MFTWLSNSFCSVLGLHFSQIIKCTWMRNIYKNNGILLSWMIVIMILIMTAIWLCPLYAVWAQAEQSCSWHISTSLFSVMAKGNCFQGRIHYYSTKKTKDWSFVTSRAHKSYLILFFGFFLFLFWGIKISVSALLVWKSRQDFRNASFLLQL